MQELLDFGLFIIITVLVLPTLIYYIIDVIAQIINKIKRNRRL